MNLKNIMQFFKVINSIKKKQLEDLDSYFFKNVVIKLETHSIQKTLGRAKHKM